MRSSCSAFRNGRSRSPAATRAARKIHVADLLSETATDELLAAVKPTHLLHFAWIATPGLYWNSTENFHWVSASERLLRSFKPAAAAGS